MIFNDIERLLNDKSVDYVDKGKDLLVRCTNPEHDDSNPSMRIDRETGKFNCFSCGHRGNIYLEFGEMPNRVNDIAFKVRNRIVEIQTQTRGIEIPNGILPFTEDFRGIKGETLERFNAFLHGDEKFENRILFPIRDVTGIVRCIQGRHKFSNAKPKYKMYPEGASIPLYPMVRGSNYIVLVEGLFDMLNLQDKGIEQAVCTFGTQNLTYANAYEKVLPYLLAGVTKILVLMDRDKAGMYAANKLVDTLRYKTSCEVVNITEYLNVDQDPGELTEKEVARLAKRIEKLVAR